MKLTRQLIVTLVSATIGAAAFGQEATPDTWMKVASSNSRDGVRLELQQAQRDGSRISSGEAYNFSEHRASTLSSQQVRAELIAARSSGEHEALNAEAYSFQPPQI